MKRVPRMLIVEDPGLLRDAIVTALRTSDRFELVGFTDVIGGARRVAIECRADVVVTDLLLAAGSTIELLRSLRDDAPAIRTVVLTSLRDGFAVRDALALGVSAYVLKTQSMVELMEAIECALAGRRYLSPQLADLLELAEHQGGRVPNEHGTRDMPAAGSGLERLSRRELEVLRLVAAGHTTAEIAHSLNISIKTIDTHRSNMYRKLAVRNSVDLVRFASLRGIGLGPQGLAGCGPSSREGQDPGDVGNVSGLEPSA